TALVRQGLRSGVVKGYDLGERLQQFRERHPEIFIEIDGVNSIFSELAASRLAGFIMDRFAGYQELNRRGLWSHEPHDVSSYEAELSALFSQASVNPAVVERFDAALLALQADGAAKAIERHFVLPVMTDMALYGAWFEVILIIGM